MATSTDVLGRFVWHELLTRDLAATLDFYQSLFPEWVITRHELGDGSAYCEIRASGFTCGGIVSVPPTSSLDAHWSAYVAIDDCAVAVRRTESLGGACVVAAMEIPHVGKVCVLKDSQGAHFKVIDLAEPSPLPANPEPGQFIWDELLTKDLGEARRFYETVFGWSSIETIIPQTGPYVLFKVGDRDVAGALTLPPNTTTPSHWLPYIAAHDVDARTARAERLGATVHLSPTDIPNIGRFAVIGDPGGAVFALFHFTPTV